jgi:N-acetylmuramic acid 6-phosphate etherase
MSDAPSELDPEATQKLASSVTEAVDERFAELDRMSSAELAELINTEDRKVAPAVGDCVARIARAADVILAGLEAGGRLFYVGAGTSGRLGIVDASECPPTYGVDPGLVQGIIAGGDRAVFRSQEGAEDDRQAGRRDLELRGFTGADVLVAISTSGRAPYVLGAVDAARKAGAATVGLSSNPSSDLERAVDHPITPVVGPEVVMGSTRMKAGTATKLVLNMLTTIVMVRSGRVRGNLMVDMRTSCAKLRARAERIVTLVAGVETEAAREALAATGGDVRRALARLAARRSE